MQYRDKYDEKYYQSYLGAAPYEDEFWKKGFKTMGSIIADTLQPKSSLEIGCAMGYLVTALRSKGVEAYGIDISDYAISKVAAESKEFCRACSGLSALPEEFPCRYDLVICIEVAEHLYPQDGELLIKNMCTYADRILFSSTADDVYEPTHHNVQCASYWAELFAKQGFYQNFAMRPQYVSPQALLFCKQNNVPQVIFQYEEVLENEKKCYEKSFSALLSDRQIAQEVMDSQYEELCQLRQALQNLKDDRTKAQEIMDSQHEELCQLQQALQQLRNDRGKAQQIMDSQKKILNQLSEALDSIKNDRQKAQDIMDAQQRKIISQEEELTIIHEDRVKAQEIMENQQKKIQELEAAFSLLQADREEAQRIMDAQYEILNRQGHWHKIKSFLKL